MTPDELKRLMETGEEFQLGIATDNLIRRYNKAKNKFEVLLEQDWYLSDIALNTIITYPLVRKPWKPTINERYWYWIISYFGTTRVVEELFMASSHHLINITFGNYFRTKEECELHTEIRDKLIEMRKEYV